jgi:hypothetical protein
MRVAVIAILIAGYAAPIVAARPAACCRHTAGHSVPSHRIPPCHTWQTEGCPMASCEPPQLNLAAVVSFPQHRPHIDSPGCRSTLAARRFPASASIRMAIASDAVSAKRSIYLRNRALLI